MVGDTKHHCFLPYSRQNQMDQFKCNNALWGRQSVMGLVRHGAAICGVIQSRQKIAKRPQDPSVFLHLTQNIQT